VCLSSGKHAVEFHNGVAADLTDASLCDSGKNAILVKSASLTGATARITLTGAEIRGSGKQPRASQAHSSAIAVELVGNKRNESRLAAITPGPPWKDVRLSDNPVSAQTSRLNDDDGSRIRRCPAAHPDKQSFLTGVRLLSRRSDSQTATRQLASRASAGRDDRTGSVRTSPPLQSACR
jgi:hypothetical protein